MRRAETHGATVPPLLCNIVPVAPGSLARGVGALVEGRPLEDMRPHVVWTEGNLANGAPTGCTGFRRERCNNRAYRSPGSRTGSISVKSYKPEKTDHVRYDHSTGDGVRSILDHGVLSVQSRVHRTGYTAGHHNAQLWRNQLKIRLLE